MQQFSAVTLSLNHYQQRTFSLLYAVIQTDTRFFLSEGKDKDFRQITKLLIRPILLNLRQMLLNLVDAGGIAGHE